MPRIVFEQASKVFPGSRGKPALDRLDLAIENGELLVLAGPSGAGKTTLLRLIAGLDALTSGCLSFDGKSVEKVSAKDRNVAMVFQTPALYPHMTAFENMAFGLKLRGCPREERERRVRDISEELGMVEFLGRRPGELSGGQAQRVALGRALVRRPEVLVLDEPFSNLDPALCNEFRRLVCSIHQASRCTTVWSTHHPSDILKLPGRIALLKEGRLEQAGTIEQLRQGSVSAFVAGFVAA